jgi:uncharacterized protein (TIGR02271 family)
MADQAVQLLHAQGFNATIDEQGNFDGFPREQADLYGSRLQEGNVLVRVDDPSNRGEEAVNAMLTAGAENIDMVRGQGTNQQGFANWNNQQRSDYYRNLGTDQRQYGTIDRQSGRGRTADQMRIALRDEQLSATKTQQEAGEVQLHKVVHEKEEQIPVTLRHEEVSISRQAVDRPLEEGELTDLQDETIRVPVYEERAQLQKQGRVREEVTINKEALEHQETLSGTTRHEHLEVQPGGDIQVQGNAADNAGYSTTNSEIQGNQYDQS